MTMKRGMSRYVFTVGSYVLKVPRADRWSRFLWGLLGNMQEAEFGSLGWPELCPVVFSLPLGFAVVAKRAEVCRYDIPVDELKAVVERAGNEGRCVPAELKASSWGTLDGRLVAVDYG